MSDATTPPSTPDQQIPPPRKKNYGWMIYFAFLLIASVGVAVFMILFSQAMQLKPEDIEKAHKLWKEKGPKNYDMVMQKTVGVGSKQEVYAIKVRNGAVQDVMLDGRPLPKDPQQTEDPRIYYSMDVFFRDIERFMDMDTKPSAPKVHKVASFDEHNGAILHYVRYEMTTKKRIEKTIKLTPVEK